MTHDPVRHRQALDCLIAALCAELPSDAYTALLQAIGKPSVTIAPLLHNLRKVTQLNTDAGEPAMPETEWRGLEKNEFPSDAFDAADEISGSFDAKLVHLAKIVAITWRAQALSSNVIDATNRFASRAPNGAHR